MGGDPGHVHLSLSLSLSPSLPLSLSPSLSENWGVERKCRGVWSVLSGVF